MLIRRIIQTTTCISLLAISISVSAAFLTPHSQHVGISAGWIGSSTNISDLPFYSTAGTAIQPQADVFDPNTDTDDDGFFGFINYQYAVNNHWLVGAEMGYKKLGKTGYSAMAKNGNISFPIFHRYDADAIDVLMTATHFWASGFHTFAKAGIARLHIDELDQRLHSFRQPEASSGDLLSSNYDTVNYRPELVLGAGWMFNPHISAYFAFSRIANSFSSIFADNHDNLQDNYDKGGDNEGAILFPNKLNFTSIMAGITLSI